MAANRLQPTGWIRASDSPAPAPAHPATSHRRSPAKRVLSATRHTQKENHPNARLINSDSPRPSPARRLALQERPDNYQPAPSPTPAKRSAPSWSDSAAKPKRLKPTASTGDKTMQTTLSAFLQKQPRLAPQSATSPTTPVASSTRNENLAAPRHQPASATCQRPQPPPAQPLLDADDDQEVFQRAQKMLKSGRFGSIPRSVRPSASDASFAARRAMASPDTSPSRPSTSERAQISPGRDAPAPPAPRRTSPLHRQIEAPRSHPPPPSRPRRAVAPRAHTTEPRPARPEDAQETPFMHEPLSNFKPFPWQERSRPLMAQLKRRAGIRETQIQEDERRLAAARLAQAHRRMEVDEPDPDLKRVPEAAGPAASGEAVEGHEDMDETQPIGAEGGEYEDEPLDDGMAAVAGPSRQPLRSDSAGRGIAAAEAGKHTHATETMGMSCVVLPEGDADADGHDNLDAAGANVSGPALVPLRGPLERHRPVDRLQTVLRSPRTNRRVYALETQFKDGAARTHSAPDLGPATVRAEGGRTMPMPAQLESAQASMPKGLRRPNVRSEPTPSQDSASSRSREPLMPPPSELRAIFGGSSPLTIPSSEEQSTSSGRPDSAVCPTTSTTPHQEVTAESGRDGGISESALAFSSSSDTPDPRHGPQDETYRDPDEDVLRRQLLKTPQRWLPPRKAALSTGKSSARQSPQVTRSGGRSQPPSPPQRQNNDAITDLAGQHQATDAEPASRAADNDDETQPLAWETDSDDEGNASEQADLRLARALNEQAVRLRASQVRSALGGGETQADDHGPGLHQRNDLGSAATSDDDARDQERRRLQTCDLHRVRGFRRRSGVAGLTHESLPAMLSHWSPPRFSPRREPAGPEHGQGRSNEDGRRAVLNSPSPGGTDRFSAILAALHRARKDEAAEEAARAGEHAVSLSADDASKRLDGQSDLARFGFSRQPCSGATKRPSASAPVTAAEAKAPLSFDLRDELSDDEDERCEREADDGPTEELLGAAADEASGGGGGGGGHAQQHGASRQQRRDEDRVDVDEDDDDATQPLAWSSDYEGGNADGPPRISQATNDSETLPFSLEARLIAERAAVLEARSDDPTSSDDREGDVTITGPPRPPSPLPPPLQPLSSSPTSSPSLSTTVRRGLERTMSSRSTLSTVGGSMPSSSQGSKDWMPGVSMSGADDAAMRFVHGR
ncbi:uncharacterized protein PFL1_06753 [Pseudozyma flocculosa PF-1]|uniref:Uncharacterized protein n=2 Tax=Pseudozyma flocculosa TaxID=84751 RepID=A0A5C3F9N3_9BASI|nr:uncharacterized protein PFL1_06753 [Pseudozyma flocculosa PF-1]EPQ25681.1 hypothetical protein PFL1_06753 [Pseudozyma flocculosa PF-1]SPO40457.1 uncharacterized protein PSFLO_05939 [Pseudozyma flocculosa]